MHSAFFSAKERSGVGEYETVLGPWPPNRREAPGGMVLTTRKPTTPEAPLVPCSVALDVPRHVAEFLSQLPAAHRRGHRPPDPVHATI